MLVHDFATVALSNDAVADLLARRGQRLVQRAASCALERAGFATLFELQLGQLMTGPQSSLVPFSLHLHDGASPFRDLDGDLEFFELEDGVSQLRLQGSYLPAPPLESSRIEHARVEAAVRLLLQELTQSLEHDGDRVRG